MSNSAENSVTAENITKRFGSKEVLKGLSLSLKAGTVFGLVGLNGTGKTTLIRLLLGLLKADSGTCKIVGMDPVLHEKKFYQRVGVVLEHNGFFGNLTVRDNLSFFTEARGISRDHLDEYFSRYWSKTDIGRDTRSVKYFSRGQKMQCALSRAFLGWPEVYFLDEPVVALDLEAYDQFCDMVRTARSRGATVIISSHQLDTIEELCNTVGILEDGSVKILEDLNKNSNEMVWLIKTNNSSEYKTPIEEIIGKPVQFHDGTWQFTLSGEGSRVIPQIISRLVSCGASVYEVRPEKESFRKSIRQYYNGGV